MRRASASGETAVTSFVAPLSSSRCTSSLFLDRSKPAYNMRGASFRLASTDDTWSVPPGRPLFMTFSLIWGRFKGTSSASVFTDDDPVRPHPDRVSNQRSNRDLAGALDVRRPGLERDHMGLG